MHVRCFHLNTLIPHSSSGYLVVVRITTGDLNTTPCSKQIGQMSWNQNSLKEIDGVPKNRKTPNLVWMHKTFIRDTSVFFVSHLK